MQHWKNIKSLNWGSFTSQKVNIWEPAFQVLENNFNSELKLLKSCEFFFIFETAERLLYHLNSEMRLTFMEFMSFGIIPEPDVHHRIMSVFNAGLLEGSKVTGIQYCILAGRQISPDSLNIFMILFKLYGIIQSLCNLALTNNIL